MRVVDGEGLCGLSLNFAFDVTIQVSCRTYFYEFAISAVLGSLCITDLSLLIVISCVMYYLYIGIKMLKKYN